MYAKMMTTQALCDAVYTIVFRAENPMSRRQICEALGKHKSPHIVRMIEHLVELGYFKREMQIDHWKRREYIYTSVGQRDEAACQEEMLTA